MDEYYDDGVSEEEDKGLMLCPGLAKDRSVHVILRPDLPKEMKTKALTRAEINRRADLLSTGGVS